MPGSDTAPGGERLKVPHMGWNRVSQARPHAIWDGIPDDTYFYFVHSYYAVPADPRLTVGETHYGARFTSAVAKANIFAVQFHTEKSADYGLSLYRNFVDWNHSRALFFLSSTDFHLTIYFYYLPKTIKTGVQLRSNTRSKG